MPDDPEELTGGLRRMWSTASLTSKLGASRMLFHTKRRPGDDIDLDAAGSNGAAIATARKLVTRMGTSRAS